MRQNTTVFKVIQEILFWLKLRKVAIISKFGSEESEKASIKVAKIFLSRKITVYTVSPASVPGTKTVEETEDLKKEKIDLAITLGGDGTTLRAFRGLGNETPMLAVNVGGNRGILSEITMDGMNNAIKQIESGNIILEETHTRGGIFWRSNW